jgi:pilus assembly protein CpaF
MTQIILSIVVIIALVAVTFILVRARINQREIYRIVEKTGIEELAEDCSKYLSEAIRTDNIGSLNDVANQTKLRTAKRLAKSLDRCIYGIEQDMQIVTAYIKDYLRTTLKDEEACCSILPLDTPLILESNYQWEVLLYISEKRYRTKIMHKLNDKYKFDSPVLRPNEDSANPMRYIVDSKRLESIFKEELGDYQFTYDNMLDILARILFSVMYGPGVVTTLRRLDVDGFNLGTSGSVRYHIDPDSITELTQGGVPIYRMENSIWVQINAKWIHFQCLDMKTENEMKRIVTRLSSWGTTAPMTEHKPWKVNDGYDGARVTTIRPPSGESWAVFVRKFSAGLYSKEKLMHKVDAAGYDILKNWTLPSMLMFFLMRSEQTVPFTGQQNTGKTSMMKAAMSDIKMVNIRVLEMSFELAIRELYPWKNVITVKPTDYVSSSQLQDLLKKTDGYLSMVGEVAEDIVAARMIQFCLIASAFTIFSHHAKTDEDLINGLANSLVACGEYENHEVAISTVLDAIKHNVHLDFKKDQRVVAFISEIVKLDEIAPYQEIRDVKDPTQALIQMTQLQREFYTRTTDRVRFESRHVLEFDPEDMTYKTTGLYTPQTLENIIKKLDVDERKMFIKFYTENWGHLLFKDYSVYKEVLISE